MSAHHTEAIQEFTKRLMSYCEATLIVSPNLSFKDSMPETNHQILIVTNGPSTYSSEEFSGYINKLQLSGKSNLHVFIGFSDDDIYNALSYDSPLFPADYISITKSSLSAETLSVLFFEQLYRAYTILQGKTYHK